MFTVYLPKLLDLRLEHASIKESYYELPFKGVRVANPSGWQISGFWWAALQHLIHW